MFEAVTTSAWFGALSAFVFEWLARKTAMRNLFALGAAAASTASLMAAHFNPARLNPAIGNMMPVLHDIWLYIHVNVIIFSYCLILMAAFTSLLYLVWRMLGGGADYAAVGGAGSLMLDPAHGAGCRSAGEVFDGATMALMELAFILLWCGIFMGAIWADHSWGRPWGWDPKEVFALNTFIVFIVLIHVRAKARDKGLWTAALALAGCAVMLFNWIVINFVISGLHSYV
ncbi:MAG: Cytochrome c biogenesis protein CcsA [candidate division BRC1 bacterium ADurb.BinA364]|nr:MAG: Cytochrome c biogenesis protein CcsA [candidate division BRC1 bacterium ADurb.BinA364]